MPDREVLNGAHFSRAFALLLPPALRARAPLRSGGSEWAHKSIADTPKSLNEFDDIEM